MDRHITAASSIAGLLLALLATRPAFAAGGQVALRTDDTADGYYYGLGGSGQDRYITEYAEGSFDPFAIICGARWREINHGSIVPPVSGDGEMRLEDPANPGYPDLSAVGLVATVDPESRGTCVGTRTRTFTFGSGAGIAAPMATQYICVIEPVHGTTGTLDFCGTLLDTSSPNQGFAKYFSGGSFGPIPWNHFVEEIVSVPPTDLDFRATGSARYPGDRGVPVVTTTRPNASGAVSDDAITLSIAIDVGADFPISGNFAICADLSVLDPKRGQKDLTPFFSPVGGPSGSIMNPLTLPPGRTILRLEARAPGVKSKLAAIVDARAANLPLSVFFDNPAFDTDPCVLESGDGTGSSAHRLGLRRRAGSADDDRIESFFRVQSPNRAGDGFAVRVRAIDLPRVGFTATGFEVVGGEFGGAGLPGLDAVELRAEDPVFVGTPDLSQLGLLRSVGAADGVGEVPLGPPPTTVTLDALDWAVAPNAASDLFVLGLLLPGETVATTSLGADTSPADTLLGDSSAVVSGLDVTPMPDANIALRLLLDGDRSTLPSARPPSPDSRSSAPLRVVGRFIAVDRTGRPLE